MKYKAFLANLILLLVMHVLFICEAGAVTKVNANVLPAAGNWWETEHF